jgi:Zn-dependent protease
MRRGVLTFRLFRIPVTVHPSHFLVSGLVAWSFAQAEADGPGASTAATAAVVLGWVAIIGLSVLVHELGHALTARRFGYPAHVQLVGLGGQTQIARGGEMPWHQDVLQTLAGPGAGLGLGVLAGLGLFAWRALGEPPGPAVYALRALFQANLFWAAVNLLPLASLDGGRIASAVLTRMFGRNGFLAAQLLSLALASIVFLFGLWTQDLLLLLLVFLLVTRTYTLLVGWYRGELPAGRAAHPLVVELDRAEAAFRAGNLDEAEAVARRVRTLEPPPTLRSRANLLVGWVLLKRGDGAGALEAFGAVPAGEVPAHAFAAAYSLSGDEARALPLWGQAAHATGNPVVLHELAGCLIRAGRVADARRLPGVKMGLAWASAERVYYVRGRFEEAAQMAEAAFQDTPSPTAAYDAACAWSRAKQPEAALRMLALAAQNGFSDAAAARGDPDLAPLRELPEFKAWLAGLGATDGARVTGP